MWKSFFFEGKIPYFRALKTILFWLALVPISIFLIPQEFKLFGQIGWYLLVFVVYIQPLSDVLPKLGLLKSFTILRKELGVLAGVFLVAHGVGFFLRNNLPFFTSIFQPEYWDFTTRFGWGMLGLTLIVIILLTSNRFALKKLGKWWKVVQRLTYAVFLAGTIHLAFQGKNGAIVLAIVFAVLWLLAYKKVVFWK